MGRFKKHIIIVGSARSGTSWLAETIGKQHRYRMLFEPDHEFQTPRGHLLSDRFVTQKEGFEEGHRYLTDVFSNRVDCNWIAQNSNRKWKRHLWPIIPKKFVIKFVRCNLSAHYIQKAFQIPVLHIIRNPYDVLQSQQRVKFPWLYDLSHFANQKPLVDLIQQHYKFNLKAWQELGDLEKLTLRWCIENVVPLRLQQAENEQYRLVYYEQLRDDINQFLALCTDFNLEPLATIKDEYTKPSSKTHPKSTIVRKNASEIIFLPEELGAINSILNIFEIDFYPIQQP